MLNSLGRFYLVFYWCRYFPSPIMHLGESVRSRTTISSSWLHSLKDTFTPSTSKNQRIRKFGFMVASIWSSLSFDQTLVNVSDELAFKKGVILPRNGRAKVLKMCSCSLVVTMGLTCWTSGALWNSWLYSHPSFRSAPPSMLSLAH